MIGIRKKTFAITKSNGLRWVFLASPSREIQVLKRFTCKVRKTLSDDQHQCSCEGHTTELKAVTNATAAATFGDRPDAFGLGFGFASALAFGGGALAGAACLYSHSSPWMQPLGIWWKILKDTWGLRLFFCRFGFTLPLTVPYSYHQLLVQVWDRTLDWLELLWHQIASVQNSSVEQLA